VPPAPSGLLGAKVENGAAVLENQKVYISFVRSDFGYGISELKMNSSSGWITAGKMPDLGENNIYILRYHAVIRRVCRT